MSIDPSDVGALLHEVRSIVEQSEERTRRTIGDAKADMVQRVEQLDTRINGRLVRGENTDRELEVSLARAEGRIEALGRRIDDERPGGPRLAAVAMHHSGHAPAAEGPEERAGTPPWLRGLIALLIAVGGLSGVGTAAAAVISAIHGGGTP